MTVGSSLGDLLGSLLGAVRDAGRAAGADVVPATLPAWAVVVRVDDGSPDGATGDDLVVCSDDYDGSVAATLPKELAGGTYRITVEGLRDADYARLRAPGRTLRASIHLWWRDSPTGVVGDLRRLVGAGEALDPARPAPPPGTCVAVVRVTGVRRQAGERRYDTVISAQERVFAALQATHVAGSKHRYLTQAAQELSEAAHVTVVTHGLTALPQGFRDDENPVDHRDGTAFEAMNSLREQTQQALALDGPSVALIRDGELHLGRWSAPDPLHPPLGADHVLDEDHGLLAVERGADDEGPAVPTGQDGLPARMTLTATALGRPDVKPGDVVRVPLPPEDFPAHVPHAVRPLRTEVADLFGSAPAGSADADQPTRCLVTEVSHRLSARQGFVTTIRATILRDETDDGWTPLPPKVAAGRAGDADGDQPGTGSTPADHASGAAGAVRGVAQAIARRVQGVRLLAGEIRAHKGSPARQTQADVYYASEEGLQQHGGLRYAPIDYEHPNQRADVSVVTPFAFGPFGLVLPRYPGTRVVLADTGGGRDVVDLGALWPKDTSPPAKAGDWWLLLPIGLSTDDPAPNQAPIAGTTDASHDLIDSTGRRLVEASSLVLRVTDKPTSSQDRPEPGDAGTVVVECVQGGSTARITIDADGGITVSGTSIALDAGDGDITMKAKNVKVSVTGTMDVS